MLNTLKDNEGARKKSKRFGRGIGSGKGKTCGRGGKGQTARSGVALAGFEGGQMPLYRRLPMRGFKSLHDKFAVVNIADLEALLEKKLISGNDITTESLRSAGLIKGNKAVRVKLLARGEAKNKFNIKVHAASESAIEALTAAGGSVTIIEK